MLHTEISLRNHRAHEHTSVGLLLLEIEGRDPVVSPGPQIRIDATQSQRERGPWRSTEDFLAKAWELSAFPVKDYVIAHALDSGLPESTARQLLAALGMSSCWGLVIDAHARQFRSPFLTLQLTLDAILDQFFIRWVRNHAPHLESIIFRANWPEDGCIRYIDYLDNDDVTADNPMARL